MTLREEQIKNDLEDHRTTVVNIVDDEGGLYIHVEFDGKERQLKNKLPDNYYVDTAMESRGPTVAVIRLK